MKQDKFKRPLNCVKYSPCLGSEYLLLVEPVRDPVVDRPGDPGPGQPLHGARLDAGLVVEVVVADHHQAAPREHRDVLEMFLTVSRPGHSELEDGDVSER